MNSMTKATTYADLERFLTKIGFTIEHSGHNYMLFRNLNPDVLIVLPSRHEDDTVDAAHLLAVRKHLLENGLLDEASFEKLLMGAKPTAASQ